MAVENEPTDKEIKDRRQQEQVNEDRVPKSLEKVDNGLIAYESKRRNHLFWGVYAIGLVILALYILLIRWVICHGTESEAWHTTILLTLAPTTLSMFVLKLLSKPEAQGNRKNEPEIDIPTVDLLSKLVNIVDKTQK